MMNPEDFESAEEYMQHQDIMVIAYFENHSYDTYE